MRGPAYINTLAFALVVLVSACAAPHKSPPVPTEANDRQIERRIANAFYTDPTAENSKVEIRAMNGDVRLLGYVASREQRDRIHQIAASTPGVRRVSNELLLPTGKSTGAKDPSS